VREGSKGKAGTAMCLYMCECLNDFERERRGKRG